METAVVKGTPQQKQNEEDTILPMTSVDTNGLEYAIDKTDDDVQLSDEYEKDPMADIGEIDELDENELFAKREDNDDGNSIDVDIDGDHIQTDFDDDLEEAVVATDIDDENEVGEHCDDNVDNVAEIDMSDDDNLDAEDEESDADNKATDPSEIKSINDTNYLEAEYVQDENEVSSSTAAAQNNSEAKAEPNESISSICASVKDIENVDERQCRVCTSTDDLVTLFNVVGAMTPADMLMSICPSLSILPQDYMPQFICNNCLDNVIIAVQLKQQLENTEQELRKKLSRSKNKIRRPKGYIVIDAPDSEPPTEEEEPEDDEFKVSDEEVGSSGESDDDTLDSDSSITKKRRKSRSTGNRKRKRNNQAKRSATNYLKASDDDLDEPTHKKRVGTNDANKYERQKGQLICRFCQKTFKVRRFFENHLAKHMEKNTFECKLCQIDFQRQSEYARHMSDEHGETSLLHKCKKCQRTFVTESHLRRHKNGFCPGEISKNKDYDAYTTGKDLFKTVAPLTTTYWSDSFSD